MRRTLEILGTGLKMALVEFRSNKLRTFLSLFGITIGIFCIIGVLATVSSLENKVQTDIKSLGSNTIYIDKWDYSGGPDYPWWKYVNRPTPTYEEAKLIKERSSLAQNVCFFANTQENISYQDNIMNNVGVYCVTEEFNKIQNIEIGDGR